MHEITIKNFGPIKEASLPINDILVFIGPQASGKSTISKAIYFFKSIKNDLSRFILEDRFGEKKEEIYQDNPIYNFRRKIRAKFLDYWGSSYHMDPFEIKYSYDKTKQIFLTLNPKDKSIFVDMSRELIVQIEKFISTINKLYPKPKEKTKILTAQELIALQSEEKSLNNYIDEQTSKIFNDYRMPLFVPAGRSLLATLSDQIHNIDSRKLDYLMREYVNYINQWKHFFNKPLKNILSEEMKISMNKIDIETVKIAENIIEKILKGKYKYDVEGDIIFFDESRFTKIKHASSGQQESLWILNQLYLFILKNQAVFIVCEEPEAHLYPEAQMNIVNLFSLLGNVNGNQIIITTHSPYVLSSLNNLLYAEKIGRDNNNEIIKIINEKFWISIKKIQVYQIENGKIRTIIEPETELIETKFIDSVSQVINKDFFEINKYDKE